jgi:hypothetical protein
MAALIFVIGLFASLEIWTRLAKGCSFFDERAHL